jgi:hypothetical protein
VTPVPPYTPKASDDFRKQAEDEHKQAGDFFQTVLGLLAAWLPGGAAVVTGIGWIRSVLRNVQANKVIYAVARGVNALPRALANGEGDGAKQANIAKLIQEVMEGSAKNEGVHPIIDGLLSKWRAQGRLGKVA